MTKRNGTAKKKESVRAISRELSERRGAAEGRAKNLILLETGERVEVVDGRAVEVRDGAGRLLVRWENGSAEIAAPTGDVVLLAPEGRVKIAGRGLDVVVDESVTVRSKAASLVTEQAQVLATRLVTTAADAVHTVERLEVRATRLFEKARDVFRDATDLVQQRAGRARTIVEDTWSLSARRTTMASKDETTIDGKKVLLG